MTDVIIGALVIVGCLFMLLASWGVARMPDLYMRLSTLTKAPTMGVGVLLIANVVASPSLEVFFKVSVILAFGFFASPIAAHMISRAAYFQGIALWEGTLIDELKGHYDLASHEPENPMMDEEAEEQVHQSRG